MLRARDGENNTDRHLGIAYLAPGLPGTIPLVPGSPSPVARGPLYLPRSQQKGAAHGEDQ